MKYDGDAFIYKIYLLWSVRAALVLALAPGEHLLQLLVDVSQLGQLDILLADTVFVEKLLQVFWVLLVRKIRIVNCDDVILLVDIKHAAITLI